MTKPTAPTIAAMRRFTRFYTRQTGVLHEGLLGSSLTLAEARVVYEIAQLGMTTATALGSDLGLDAGYLSRMLKSLVARGIVERTASPTDARQSDLALTVQGKQLFTEIDAASKREVGGMLSSLSRDQHAELLGAMTTIEQLLAEPAVRHSPAPAILRPHRPGDIGWVVHRHAAIYAAEYGWDISFEALVAKVGAEFIENFDAQTDCCLIAERDGAILGSAFVVPKDSTTAKLRLVYVEASERGTGLGRRLVEGCMLFARKAGYRRMTLWTNDILVPARKLYESLGFALVAAEPHTSFGKDLVSETWERDL